ncbi:MAG: NADH-quinone oxidoreductase subunit C [Bacillota bacterium]|nr:MAG: NADH-quinone oxidoreductase subunit C [Bacillota bacterium]
MTGGDLTEKRTAAAEAIRSYLASSVPSADTAVRPDGELEVRVAPRDLLRAAQALAEAEPYPLRYLSCVSGVDWVERGRIEVVYSLYSMPGPEAKVSLRVETDRDVARASIPSLAGIWPTADFHEREIYDLLGVTFEGHPDLRRILLDESFVGHPLRKDFVDQRPAARRVTRGDYQA